LLAKVRSAGLFGIDGYIIEVEVDISSGLPFFDIVGLPDTAVKESRERVRAAIKNSGLEFPVKRITVNLAPADTKKEGPAYDLAIAVAILLATEQIPDHPLARSIFLGELSLDGSIRPIHGVLPALLSVKEQARSVVLSCGNAAEASHVKEIDVYTVNTLNELVSMFKNEICPAPYKKAHTDINHTVPNIIEDFSDVKGQEGAKRALEIAAAGGHNAIMIGPPGSGKTMLARRLPSILPELTYEESLEITKIYSAAGLLDASEGLISLRPFRSPHHTISTAALVGGGRIPQPGEISLAHHGVLFLDELPEFRRDVLEALRQPLEDGVVTISRSNGTAVFPASFTLIGSANPCPCGFFGDNTRECLCTPMQINRYLGKISGPLMDRFDIQIEVPAIPFEDLSTNRTSENSASIRSRVNTARRVQTERYKNDGIFYNSQLNSKLIDKYCHINAHQKKMMRNAFVSLNLSARAYGRILKVARTIADLEGTEKIQDHHLAEAIQYRRLDRQFWV
jgi:magnesium chelatase family protein